MSLLGAYKTKVRSRVADAAMRYAVSEDALTRAEARAPGNPFVRDLRKSFEQYKGLTDSQLEALENIKPRKRWAREPYGSMTEEQLNNGPWDEWCGDDDPLDDPWFGFDSWGTF